jgi:hypothetical protein
MDGLPGHKRFYARLRRAMPGNDGSGKTLLTSRRGELLVLCFRALQRRARGKPIGVSNEF